MDKLFFKIIFWIVVYTVGIGYLLPTLYSAKSTPLVLVGVIISILLLYPPFKYLISKEFKNDMNSFLARFRKNDNNGE